MLLSIDKNIINRYQSFKISVDLWKFQFEYCLSKIIFYLK